MFIWDFFAHSNIFHSAQEAKLDVQLYELHGWERDTPVPSDVSDLVRITDIILSSVNVKISPPLFVCG